MLNFLADQTIPDASVEEIRALGNEVEVVEASTAEARGEFLRRASREGRIVLTFDFGYHALIFEDNVAVPSGVVCFEMEYETPRDPANVLAAVLTGEDIELDGHFSLLDDGRMRQKPMPNARG